MKLKNITEPVEVYRVLPRAPGLLAQMATAHAARRPTAIAALAIIGISASVVFSTDKVLELFDWPGAAEAKAASIAVLPLKNLGVNAARKITLGMA